MSTDSLVNTGVAVLSPAANESSERTILVVGVARGGTSIAAGALHALGVPMGERCSAPVYEDLRISNAFENAGEEAFSDVVAAYNRSYPVWGWKRPSMSTRLEEVTTQLRNPHLIFVFRDLFSIANRNAISMKNDLKSGLLNALDGYRAMVDFLVKTDIPALAISSDKVVRHKQEFIDALEKFCGLTPSVEQRMAALEFISPDPEEYLDKTRITKSRGTLNVDLLRTGILRGWARAIYHPRPVVVEVEVNGVVIREVLAERMRDDLRSAGVHPTGACGFQLDLKPLGVQPGDVLNVRVKDEVVSLNPEPISFPDCADWQP